MWLGIYVLCMTSHWKVSGFRLLLPDSFAWRHERLFGMVWTARAQGGTSRSHTSNIVPAKLAERVWCTKFQSSLLDIYFRLSGFQPSILLIYFCDGPNRCSHCTKIWQKTYSRSARRRFAPSQKSHRHNSFYVWTESLSGMIFVAAQKLAGTRCGHTLRRAVTANKCTQKAWCTCRIVVLVIKPFEVAVAVVVAEPFKSH